MESWIQQIRRRLRGPARPDAALLARAHESGDPFKSAAYFAEAEPDMERQWRDLIWPRIEGLDFGCVLDLAAGHGRNSARLIEVADELIIVDINEECLDACRKRFGANPRIRYVRTDGSTLASVGRKSVSLLYSFDSMVHFAPDVVRFYLGEAQRVLRSGAHGFCHHSNYTGNPDGDFRSSPHWRNYMSSELFASHCKAAGLQVVQSDVIDWGHGADRHKALDGLTLFRKP